MAKEYEIARASGSCRGCGRELASGEEFFAALYDEGADFRRTDFCAACWEARQGGADPPFSVWRSRVPPPAEPRRQSVDSGALIDFFNRLEGADEPAKVNFRFVLALMLMRKKLLVYEGSAADEAGRDVWQMRFRQDQTAVEVVHPELDEERIAEVTEQLGSIFEGSA